MLFIEEESGYISDDGIEMCFAVCESEILPAFKITYISDNSNDQKIKYCRAINLYTFSTFALDETKYKFVYPTTQQDRIRWIEMVKK